MERLYPYIYSAPNINLCLTKNTIAYLSVPGEF